MNEEMVEALKAMQDSGWGVGGRLVEEDPRIEANYRIGEIDVEDEAAKSPESIQ